MSFKINEQFRGTKSQLSAEPAEICLFVDVGVKQPARAL